MKKQGLPLLVGVALLLAGSLLYVGCESDDTNQNITATLFQVERDLGSYDGTDVYDWDTTLSQAHFDIRIKDFHAGDAAIEVYDATGKLLLLRALVAPNYTIYSGDHEFVSVGQTAHGTPGHWVVKLSYNQFTGDQKITLQ